LAAEENSWINSSWGVFVQIRNLSVPKTPAGKEVIKDWYEPINEGR
jgi:hypothetical protein